MPGVDLRAFAAALATGATVIDVRRRSEYAAGHVPGACLLPQPILPMRLGRLRALAPVYVLCGSGRRSSVAAQTLVENGVEAYWVAGGTNAWAAEGRPVIRGAPQQW